MKNKIPYLLLTAFIMVAGCQKDPEKEPLDKLTQGYVFDSTDISGGYAEEFLNSIYTNLPSGFNRIDGNILDAGTDDAIPSEAGSTVENFTDGRISPFENPDNPWGRYYKGIRDVNLFLANIDRVPADSQLMVYWKADARFLRALFYFELIRAYGGVPLIGDTVYHLTDDIEPKRNTFAECVDYITSECDAIKDMARTDPVGASDWGRISKGIVLTLKAKVLLYAASPLFNGGTEAGTPELANLEGYPTYDPERWQKAAQAAKDVIDLHIYSLEPNYSNVFLTRRNKEVILSHLRNTTSDVETNNGPVGYAQNASGQGMTSPTQDLVDAFEMQNGEAISDPASGYDPTNPYAGRDPRFYSTILFNGAQWLMRPLETFENGQDKPNTNIIQTQTGYYMRKFMADFTKSSAYSPQNHNFIIFRYADVLLWYAEALNEYEGPVQDVYDAVESIRERAGLDPYQLPHDLTKEEMRAVIRHERRVEFAFEESRFWDIRRWKTADSLLNGTLTGMKIVKNQDSTFSYSPVPVEKTFFSPNMYLYPIPYSETSKNKNLTQNSGW